jgi:hypothetical protein
METQTIITVYIKQKPYDFHIEIDKEKGTTTYYVSSKKKNIPEYVPENLEFDVDGVVSQQKGLKTVEQEQIARLIWQEILDKLNP